MKNKWKVCIASALVAITSVALCANVKAKAEDKNNTLKFSSEIVALTPHSGETVSIVHNGIEGMINLNKLTVADVGKYYYFRPEMQIWNELSLTYYDTQEKVWAFYNECDDFAPINNNLQWNYAKGADSYTVAVALDKEFKNVVFTDTVATNSVNLGNTLYSGTDYYWQVIANDGEEKTYSQIFEFTTKVGTRTVDIDGVSNTRDVGGYQTPNGKTAQGLLYRTARLDDITEDGLATIQKLGVKTDLDLRSVGEGAVNPMGVENYVNATPAPIYTNGIATPEGKEALKTIFSILANRDNYPVALHCTVGRDRTGTAIALVNSILGVDEQTVVNEYMLSVFGAVSSFAKGSDALITNINNLMLYINTFAGETLAKRAEALLLDAGVTAEQIKSVRDIMLGDNYDNTIEYTTLYENTHFVTFKAYGYAKQILAVKDGFTVESPYAIGDDFVWTINGEVYDFSKPVAQDLTIEATEKEYVKITVVVSGQERVIQVIAGDTIDFTQFQKDGYTYKVMNDKGDIITSLTAEKPCAVTIIYFKN
ncbi:MAG: tyrosine-protein phosphatase [Clostridia bacterium]|nr:tyrosine-protein phosphatase [Clostridia bacterium]